MFWLAATLHEVGALAALTRQVPFGPAACGQLATPPTAGGAVDASPVTAVPESDSEEASSPGPLPPLELPEDESGPLPELLASALPVLEPVPEAPLDPVEAPLPAGAPLPQDHPKSGPPTKQTRAPAMRIDDLRSKSMGHRPLRSDLERGERSSHTRFLAIMRTEDREDKPGGQGGQARDPPASMSGDICVLVTAWAPPEPRLHGKIPQKPSGF
jgi:hypothetical protein